MEKQKATTRDALIGLVIVLGVIWALVKCSGPSDEERAREVAAQAEAEAKCRQTLQCYAEKGVSAASVYCQDPVERLAKHAVRWTDGTLESKFSHFRWKDQTAGSVTYAGDKAQFQNGFGAYTPVTYECDLAADRKTVIDVRVREGRLPP